MNQPVVQVPTAGMPMGTAQPGGRASGGGGGGGGGGFSRWFITRKKLTITAVCALVLVLLGTPAPVLIGLAVIGPLMIWKCHGRHDRIGIALGGIALGTLISLLPGIGPWWSDSWGKAMSFGGPMAERIHFPSISFEQTPGQTGGALTLTGPTTTVAPAPAAGAVPAQAAPTIAAGTNPNPGLAGAQAAATGVATGAAPAIGGQR